VSKRELRTLPMMRNWLYPRGCLVESLSLVLVWSLLRQTSRPSGEETGDKESAEQCFPDGTTPSDSSHSGRRPSSCFASRKSVRRWKEQHTLNVDYRVGCGSMGSSAGLKSIKFSRAIYMLHTEYMTSARLTFILHSTLFISWIEISQWWKAI
jgi:hypothetical protein